VGGFHLRPSPPCLSSKGGGKRRKKALCGLSYDVHVCRTLPFLPRAAKKRGKKKEEEAARFSAGRGFPFEPVPERRGKKEKKEEGKQYTWGQPHPSALRVSTVTLTKPVGEKRETGPAGCSLFGGP